MKGDKVVLGFLAGAAIGAIAGILFAPDKGSETRKKISRRTSEFGETLKDSFNEFVDRVKEGYDSVKSDADELVEKGKTDYKTIKNEIKSTM
jgi:gas vesicle protein